MQASSMLSALPPEIIDEIFSHLMDASGGRRTLKSCALVCRSFLHPARVRLFRRLAVRNGSDRSRFCRLAQEAPHLTSCIKNLYINGFGLFLGDIELPQALEHLVHGINGPPRAHLQEVTLDDMSWPDLSRQTQLVLLKLLACESLHRVALDNIDDFPVQHFSAALKSLRINNTRFPARFRWPAVPQRLPELEWLTVNLCPSKYQGQTLDILLQKFTNCIVDAKRLRVFNVFSCNKFTWSTYRRSIYTVSRSLEQLHIQTCTSKRYFTPIDLSQFPRLHSVTISTYRLPLLKALTCVHAAISWLARSLEGVLRGNMINALVIRVLISDDAIQQEMFQIFQTRLTADWKRLDDTLSRPELASSTVFHGITFQLCTASGDLYCDLAASVRSKLPKAWKLKKLDIQNS